MEMLILMSACVVTIIMYRAFYKEKHHLKKANILSIGYNRMGEKNGLYPGVHAEHDAINKLKPLSRNKHLKAVNLLVIRVSKNNKLQSSKPCANCIKIIKSLPIKKGYRVRNIYYSDDNGNIIKTNINNLEKDELHYSKFFRKKMRNI